MRMKERCCDQVVRVTWLWCRKLLEDHEFWALLSDDWKTVFVHPAVNGYLFCMREGEDSERRGMGSTFHMPFPQYSGPLTPHCLSY